MSDDPKLSGLDPFCQRGSIKIAADVGAAAVRVLRPLELLPYYISLVAHNKYDCFDGPEEAHDFITVTHEELADETASLGELFDKVSQ